MSNKNPLKTTSLIRFLGGQNLIFSLVSLVLLCVLVLLLNTISFVFIPISAVFTAIATPLLLAIIFYYMFIPLVDKLEQYNIPRSIGATIAIIVLIGLIALSIGIVIPIIFQQIVGFANGLPEVVNNFVRLLQQYTTTPEFQLYYNQIVSFINNSLSNIVNQFASTLGSTLQGLTTVLSAISNVLVALMTFPIILFFLLLDGRKFKNMFLKILPKKARHEIDDVFHQINVKVGGYIKGRLLVSFLIGVYFFFVYSFLNINYAFVLGLLAGLLSMIPYLGSLIALVPVLIIVIPTSTLTTILTLIFWGVGQILDGNILGPLIIGKNLDIHPLTILIILLGAGSMFGIVGMIIGVPVYAIIKIIFNFLFAKYTKRYVAYFGEENSDY